MRQLTEEPRAFDVVGFGECSIDEVWVVPSLPPAGKMRALKRDRLGGGQIATAMAACARLGLRAAFCATVGDDPDATELIAGLEDEGVDVAGIQRYARASTRVALLLVDERGDRAVIETARAASLPAPPMLRDRIEAARVVHLDVTEPAYAMLAAHHAREHGTFVSLDIDHPAPGLDDLLPLVDLCIAARGVAEQLTGESHLEAALRALQAKTGGLVGCTLDGDGAALLDDGHLLLSPAFPVDHLVDTTACGDTFRAAFLCALLEAQPPRQALRFANAAAALKCRDIGRRGCPTRAEVNALMAMT
ncbi:MAG: PfkB domain protein [Myxococcales bacterium]|nr:PfkB domain protein [Myxococcales bacterium]